MTEDVTYDLHQSLTYHLSLAARMMERRLDDGLRELGLTRVTWCVLLALGPGGCGRPSEIAEFIGIDRTAASRALGVMEAQGLIARATGRDDRRTTTVALTEAGRRTLARGVPVAKGANAKLRAQLSVEEGELLDNLLTRLISAEELNLRRF